MYFFLKFISGASCNTYLYMYSSAIVHFLLSSNSHFKCDHPFIHGLSNTCEHLDFYMRYTIKIKIICFVPPSQIHVVSYCMKLNDEFVSERSNIMTCS